MDDLGVERIMFGGNYNNKKILITGNTGFKGSWLTIWLLNLGAKVYGFSKDIPTNPSMFNELDLKNKITHYQKDVRDLNAIKEVVDKVKPDFVFHLAAQSLVSVSYADPIDTISTNILGTANVLEALRESNHECYNIIITSDKCYDNVEWVWGYKETDALGGKDIYSGSKGSAELIINSYFRSFFNKGKSNIKLATARAGNVVGGGDWAKDRIVPDCMRAWSNNEVVTMRSPNATRPWQHVLEPLSGYLALGSQLKENSGLNGESFNFGPLSKYNRTVEDILKDLSKYWDFEEPSESYNITNKIEFHEAGLLKLNCDKALFYLKWLPTLSYSDFIKFTGSWYHAFYKKKYNMLNFTFDQIDKYQKIAFKKGITWAK